MDLGLPPTESAFELYGKRLVGHAVAVGHAIAGHKVASLEAPDALAEIRGHCLAGSSLTLTAPGLAR